MFRYFTELGSLGSIGSGKFPVYIKKCRIVWFGSTKTVSKAVKCSLLHLLLPLLFMAHMINEEGYQNFKKILGS